MNNTYFLMRHAQSEANRQGLVISDPRVACSAYGITAAGMEQIRPSWEALIREQPIPADSIIISSDFLRAKQTAEALASYIGLKEIRLDTRLRDRFFGDLEGGPDSQYRTIWKLDAINPHHTQWDCESAVSVANRMQELIRELEQANRGATFFLVSHGDPIQILITAALFRTAKLHRSTPTVKNADIVRLLRGEGIPKTDAGDPRNDSMKNVLRD